MPRYEALQGLPPYGPPAEQFTATGHGAHREGFVVRFEDDEGRPWVGNFQPGVSGVDTVLDHPDGHRVIVLAGGQGYIVDPENRQSRFYFGGDIEAVFSLPELGVIFGDGLGFEAIGPGGPLWRTGRISWDGMQKLEIAGSTLTGDSWDAINDMWVGFELELITGRWVGGSFAGFQQG